MIQVIAVEIGTVCLFVSGTKIGIIVILKIKFKLMSATDL